MAEVGAATANLPGLTVAADCHHQHCGTMATLKRQLPATGFADNKRRAITDLAEVGITSKADSYSELLHSLGGKQEPEHVYTPRPSPAAGRGSMQTTAGQPATPADPTEECFHAAQVPPSECICPDGCKNGVANDRYGLHFRCTDCDGNTEAWWLGLPTN